jgi:hypothetical protein
MKMVKRFQQREWLHELREPEISRKIRMYSVSRFSNFKNSYELQTSSTASAAEFEFRTVGKAN